MFQSAPLPTSSIRIGQRKIVLSPSDVLLGCLNLISESPARRMNRLMIVCLDVH